MAKETYMCLLFLSFLIICCSGTMVGFSYHERGHTASSASTLTTFLMKNKISQSQVQFFCFFCSKSSILSKRESLSKVHVRRILDDTTNNSPTTVFPTNPSSTTPIITPPDSPAIITVPSTNPVTVSPTNPAAMPGTVPSTTPAIPLSPTNPANSPVPVTNPVTAPITVPGTPPATTTNPVTSIPPPLGNTLPPPGNTNVPTTPGQGWCVAKTGVPETTLQSALDYCCGMDSSACSQIQQGGSCYNPNSLQNHASVAFNSYYQKNPAPTSCDFGGAATLVNTNPSSGSCIYTSSSASSSTSSSGAGTFGSSGPASVFGSQSPPPDNVDTSHSAGLRPFIGCMVLLISGVHLLYHKVCHSMCHFI